MYLSKFMISYLDPDSASVCISALPWQNPMYDSLKFKMKPRYLKLWKTCTKIQMEYDDRAVYTPLFYWFINGQRHREHDMPAIEYADGDKSWYKNGQRHRDHDKPAIDHVDGDKAWYKNGQLHRDDDKPAIEYANGDKYWYKNDRHHRENGKPIVEYADGEKEW